MDNATLQRVKDLLAKNDKIGIIIAKDPNIDQMGAGLALYLSLRQLNKSVSIASPSEPVVGISSLVGIDKVKTALEGDGGDLIVSFPYREGEIEKVSYTLEDGYLNIVVKASEEGLSFQENDVRFKRLGGIPTLLFIIGTQRLSDLGSLFDPDTLKNTTVVNIDNQSDNQGFGDVVLVSPRYSSVSEQIGSLLQSLDLSLDIDAAQNLLSGISFATNNFQDQKTSYLAFEMAALLLKKGARRMGATKEYSKQEESQFMPYNQPLPQQQPQQERFNREKGKQRWEDRQQQVQSQRSQQQPQRPKQQLQQEEKTDQETPPDWLAPKVYKSSTLV